MKNKIQAYTIILFSAIAVLLSGCRKEKIKPEQAEMFIKYYGKGGTQKAGNVALTADGGYVLVGTSNSYGNGNDILVVKTDKYGNEEWSKVLGGTGDDAGNWVIVAKDGSYVIAGFKTNVANNKTDASIIKLNIDGNVVFDSVYGELNYNERFNKIQETDDNGFIAVGQTDHVNPLKPDGTSTDDNSDMFLLKTDINGRKDWNVTIGIKVSDIGTAVQQFASNQFVTTATSTSPQTSDIQITNGQIQKVGNTTDYSPISNQNKGTLKQNVSAAVDLIYDKGNAFYVLGNTDDKQIYLLKLDINGDPVPDSYKTFNVGTQSSAVSFSKSNDNGFVITGTTLNDQGDFNVLLIKTTENGTLQWANQFGGNGNDTGNGVSQALDGGYIVSATIVFGGNATGANAVMSLIHVDVNGQLK